MFSPEFVNFSSDFGTPATAYAAVVTDFYRGLLWRMPDSGGFDFWSQRFYAAKCAGAAAVHAQAESISSAFTNSTEYNNRGRNTSQYVGDLYNAFLRRGGDLTGVQYWIDQIDSGARTREQVRQAFVASPEFNARVMAIVNDPTPCP
jgi:hypothetical protein